MARFGPTRTLVKQRGPDARLVSGQAHIVAALDVEGVAVTRFGRSNPLILVVACAIVTACEPAVSASPTVAPATPPPSPTASVARPSPTPIDQPLPTPAGITPASDRILLNVESWTDIGPWGPGVIVYDDGSIVSAQSRPMTVLPLSSTGLAWLLQRVRESGLFTSSRSIAFEPPDHGFTTYRVTFNDGGASTWVMAANAATDSESQALIELAEHISDPGAWVPTEGWLDGDARPRPYVARQTRVTTESRDLAPGDRLNGAQTLDRLAWPLSVSPLDLGSPVSVPGEENRALRCAFMSGIDEAAVRRALEGFEGGGEDQPLIASWYLWTAGPGLLKLTLRPLLPHEPAVCDVAELPSRPRLAEAPHPSLATMLVLGQNGWSPTGTSPRFFVQATDVSGESPSAGRVSYYADGTILFADPPPPIVGMGALRLSSDGLQLIEATMRESGLLGTSYSEQIPDEVEIDTMFSIVTEDVVLNGSDRGVDDAANRIAELARRLLDPVTWLPTSAWIGDPQQLLQYRPPAIKVSIRREDDFGAVLRPIGLLGWPWKGTVWTFGKADAELPGIEARVATVSAADALKIVQAVQLLGVRGDGGPTGVEYWLASEEPGTKVVIELSIASGEWGP